MCKTLMQCLDLHIIVCALVMSFSVDLSMWYIICLCLMRNLELDCDINFELSRNGVLLCWCIIIMLCGFLRHG